jgi:RHS repeat-associated protein
MDDQKRIALIETKTVDNGTIVATPQPLARYQMGNHLGSAVLELNGVGKVISYEEFHPYGTTAYHAGTSAVEDSPKRYRYTGKERDEETGFSYHHHRYLSNQLGRWLSTDILGLIDGPNLYLAMNNKPTSHIDPQGTQPVILFALFSCANDTPVINNEDVYEKNLEFIGRRGNEGLTSEERERMRKTYRRADAHRAEKGRYESQGFGKDLQRGYYYGDTSESGEETPGGKIGRIFSPRAAAEKIPETKESVENAYKNPTVENVMEAAEDVYEFQNELPPSPNPKTWAPDMPDLPKLKPTKLTEVPEAIEEWQKVKGIKDDVTGAQKTIKELGESENTFRENDPSPSAAPPSSPKSLAPGEVIKVYLFTFDVQGPGGKMVRLSKNTSELASSAFGRPFPEPFPSLPLNPPLKKGDVLPMDEIIKRSYSPH